MACVNRVPSALLARSDLMWLFGCACMRTYPNSLIRSGLTSLGLLEEKNKQAVCSVQGYNFNPLLLPENLRIRPSEIKCEGDFSKFITIIQVIVIPRYKCNNYDII